VRPLERRLREWQRVGRRSFFFSVDLGGCLLLWDLRPGRREPLRILRGVERALYQACDAAADLRQLASALERAGTPLASEALAAHVGSLVANGALLQDGSRYLALAIPLGEYVLPEAAVGRMRDLLRTLGRRCKGGYRVPLDTMVPPPRPTRPPRAGAQGLRVPSRSFDPSHFQIDPDGQLVVRLL
jgi:hypothetical protein